jgi:hypothetical protein
MSVNNSNNGHRFLVESIGDDERIHAPESILPWLHIGARVSHAGHRQEIANRAFDLFAHAIAAATLSFAM